VSTPCPDEDEIVAYAQGHLGAAIAARIAAHVDDCPACVGLVAEAARATATRPVDGQAAAPRGATLGRGSVLGRYLVLDLLGQGGLGRVFAAYDPELDRRVAIKLLDPAGHGAVAPADLRARLLREAQALAKLRHPNVVAVHDVGIVDTQVFVAMELVDGCTLRDWLLAKERSWSEIRDAFVEVAVGLAAVHDAGLVHRDIKPTNILVGNDGRVHIADFGLARALGPEESMPRVESLRPRESALDAVLTASGNVMGTPAYMAPEQHRGARVDARADQFGFGVALFEALHGTRPFAGSTSAQLAAAASAGAVVEIDARHVPTWLRRVALRGIAADPADRFTSMHEMLTALQQDRRTRRWRAIAGAGGLVLGGAALWGLVIAPALAPGPDAREAVDALVHEARAAAAQTHFVHPPPDDPARATAYTKVLELEALEGAAEELADASAAELRIELATTLVGLGDRFWAIEGGAPIAAEYYASALVFDDEQSRALERVGMSIATLVALRERAATLSFAGPELVAVAPVLALASVDDTERARRIEAAYARTPEPPLAITDALEVVLGAPGRDAVERGRRRRATIEVPREMIATVVPPASTAAEPAIDREATPAATSRTRPAASREPTAAEPTADSAGARRHIADGRRALERGDLADAESAFHRALAADRNDVAALAGLADVSFEQRAYERSAKFLERAVDLAPKNAQLRLDLGDVYFKVLRYDDARTHYDRAKALGHSGAARRLERLDERLGEGR
jgi:tetratricopeptide (TPR) repeat protein